jgi:hypothetical protein
MAGETKTFTVGADISSLDIFLSAGGTATNANSVGYELFDSAGTSAASGIAVNPATGQYQASGVIPASFQVGTWRIDWNIITTGSEFVSATEPFCVQAIDITIGFVPTTDKTGTIYDAVRIDIGDPDAQVFDDNFLSRVLTKAARRLNQRLGLSITTRPQGVPGGFGGRRLKVSPITVDLAAGTISPNNDEICDLIVLQMEYIIVTSETSALKRLGASVGTGPFAAMVQGVSAEGIKVVNADGVTVEVSAGRLQARVALQKLDVSTREKELEMAIRSFLNRNTGNFGKMIY